DHAQIRRHKSHRVIVSARKMGEKLRVTGKAVPTEEQCPLVNWRGCDRVDASRRTKFDGSFDIATRGPSGSARFDSRLDVSLYVVEMKNYRLSKSPWQLLIVSHDLITAL